MILGPCSCSMFRGQMLPTWRGMPLWLLPLVLPPSLQPLLTINVLAKVWLPTWLCGLVSHKHLGTCTPCAIKACNEGIGHRQGEPWE